MSSSCRRGSSCAGAQMETISEHPDAYTLKRMDEAGRRNFWASLALRYSCGIGPRTWKRLLTWYGSPYAAVMDVADWAAAGVPATRADSCRRGLWREQARAEWDAAGKAGYKILLWNDPRYPERLKEIPDPPLFLYYLGDASLLSAPMVGVVGARRCSRYGLDVAACISRELSRRGITIASGLARGIDRQAHIAALEGIGSSVAVLGNGPDQIYPPENRDVLFSLAGRGLVVTEFAPGVPPESKNFPVRNRIISGLSLGILVVEAAARSGSLITARLALEQGREVFAVPGRITAQTSSGCHELIKQGARTVCGAEDILLELAPLLRAAAENPSAPAVQEPMHPHTAHSVLQSAGACCHSDVPSVVAAAPADGGAAGTEPAASPADADGQKVLAVLARRGGLHIDVLCRELDWDAGRVSAALLLLEIAGSVRQAPGMLYCPA